jgi:catechol 2,3-dioxygenase
MKFQQHPYTYVSHVHLFVSDLERSLLFYQKVIGFQVLEKNEQKAVLTADGKTALLTIEQPEHVAQKQSRTTGLYHFALLLPTRADLARVLMHLVKSGYPLQGASDHDVSEAIYLGDPDGNGIEIAYDRPADKWTWANGEVGMTTVALDTQDLFTEIGGKEWNGLPAETVMGHIHLHVAELEKTKEFYTKGLSFDVVLNYGAQALFISTGGYHHHIGLNIWNGIGAPAPKENSPGMKSFNLILPSEEARKNTVANLQQLGAFVQDENGVVLTKDPSGNTIHLLV